MIIDKNLLLNTLQRRLPPGNRAFILSRTHDFRVLGILKVKSGNCFVVAKASYYYPVPDKNKKPVTVDWKRNVYYWAFKAGHGDLLDKCCYMKTLDWKRLVEVQDVKDDVFKRLKGFVNREHKTSIAEREGGL